MELFDEIGDLLGNLGDLDLVAKGPDLKLEISEVPAGQRRPGPKKGSERAKVCALRLANGRAMGRVRASTSAHVGVLKDFVKEAPRWLRSQSRKRNRPGLGRINSATDGLGQF